MPFLCNFKTEHGPLFCGAKFVTRILVFINQAVSVVYPVMGCWTEGVIYVLVVKAPSSVLWFLHVF